MDDAQWAKMSITERLAFQFPYSVEEMSSATLDLAAKLGRRMAQEKCDKEFEAFERRLNGTH